MGDVNSPMDPVITSQLSQLLHNKHQVPVLRPPPGSTKDEKELIRSNMTTLMITSIKYLREELISLHLTIGVGRESSKTDVNLTEEEVDS